MASRETVSEKAARDAVSPLAGRTRGLSRFRYGAGPLIARGIGLVVSIGIALVAFPTIKPNFAKVGNRIEIARSMSALRIMALGLTLLIIVGELDLSVGATYGLAAMVLGKVWLSGIPFPLALAIGLGVGAAVGAV